VLKKENPNKFIKSQHDKAAPGCQKISNPESCISGIFICQRPIQIWQTSPDRLFGLLGHIKK
jgi:hypothetical protein